MDSGAPLEPLLDSLSNVELAAIAYDWREWWARPEQVFDVGEEVRSIGLCTGRGYGKHLCMHTPIPVPPNSTAEQYAPGWSTMGALKRGDMVYDENGKPCKVTQAFEPEVPEQCYRVHFSDGTHLDASSTHEWVTWTHRDRKAFLRSQYEGKFPPEDWPNWKARRVHPRFGGEPRVFKNAPGPTVRTTEEILKTLRQGKRGDLNHSIPICPSLQGEPVDIGIHPYVLGAWLGDGSSACAAITIGDVDLDAMQLNLIQCGAEIGCGARKPGSAAGTYSIGKGWLHRRLRLLGLLKNKHVPEVMFLASAEQRLYLLQGLMDTDGCPTQNAHVEFCSTKKVLAEAVLRLARSLGQKPVIAESDAKIYGRVVGRKWRVTWRPTIDVFRLPRKSAMIPAPGAQSSRTMHRMIVDVVPIPSRQMRCIQVDSPNSLYLAGEGLIPTHNTRALAEYVIEEVKAGRAMRIALIAQNEDKTWEVMVHGDSGLLECSPPWFKARVEKGRVIWPNGAQAFPFTPEVPGDIRGPGVHLAWCTEFVAWPPTRRDEAWSNVRMMTRLGYARVIWDTTPKRRHPIIRDLLLRAMKDPRRHVIIRGSTRANVANLSSDAIEEWEAEYGGTSRGREELDGEYIDDADGALFRQSWIESARRDMPGTLARVAIGLDPAISMRANTDQTGLVVCGLGVDRQAYVLRDCSARMAPEQWTAIALDLYREHRADCIVVERNRGGDLVVHALRASAAERGLRVEVLKHDAQTRHDGRVIYVKEVIGASSKSSRAEVVVPAFERGRVSFVNGQDLGGLEDMCCTWDPSEGSKSPDALDAMVYALIELLGIEHGPALVAPPPSATLALQSELRRRMAGVSALVGHLPRGTGGRI